MGNNSAKQKKNKKNDKKWNEVVADEVQQA